VQACFTAVVRNLDIQILLEPAQGTAVGHLPPQATQMKHRLHQTHRLPECQAKQVLGRQAKLNGCIRELRAAPAVAAASGKPRHAFVLPNRQGTASLEGALYCFQFVVR